MLAKNKHGSYHIPQWKIDEINDIVKLIKSNRAVGVLSFEGIMGNQFQKMRHSIHNIATVKVVRNTLIEKSFSDSALDFSISELKKYISSQTALVFSNENPFKLYKLLEQTKTKSPIKAGSIAPFDIEVKKGPTSFPPGPILGELQSSGIPVSVESGKIVVKENKIVCKSGEKVSQKLATSLSKLGIYPLDVGLVLHAVYSSGTLFVAEDLNIDNEKYFLDIITCVQNSMNLSINICYPTKETIFNILCNSEMEALGLGINCSIYNKKTIHNLILNGINQMFILSNLLLSINKDSISNELELLLLNSRCVSNSIESQNTVTQLNNNIKEKEEEPDHSEEDGMAGLGSLFG